MIAAGVLVVLILISYLTGSYWIRTVTSQTKETLKQCEEEYEKKEGDAEATAKELCERWAKQEKGLSFFVNHETLDEIELTLSSVAIFAETDEKEMFKEALAQVHMLLHQLNEDSRISIHSIF